MGILDEAIREHLELKRQHGAADNELEQLEDEAFGPPARPGDAPSETAVAEPPGPEEAPTTVQPVEGLGALQEAPEPEPAPEAEPPGEADEPLPEPAETSSVRAETEEHPPPEGAVEEEPFAKDAAEPPADAEAAPTDQATEFYDVEGGRQPPDEGEEVIEDEFFSEQSLSDELDKALDAPDAGPAPDLGETPVRGEEEPLPTEEAPSEEPVPEAEGQADEGEEGEDVLEETPEFLQDSPEHDRLWFEQKPPKDFDFDD
jgi:hypothetical protein